MFRRVRGSFSFFAKGGDDPRGDIEVEVRTIEPPLVAQIEARITPPTYTREPETTTSGGVIEALSGSQVERQLRDVGLASVGSRRRLE